MSKNSLGEIAAFVSDARSFTANHPRTRPETPVRIVAVRRAGGFASGGTVLMTTVSFDEVGLIRWLRCRSPKR